MCKQPVVLSRIRHTWPLSYHVISAHYAHMYCPCYGSSGKASIYCSIRISPSTFFCSDYITICLIWKIKIEIMICPFFYSKKSFLFFLLICVKMFQNIPGCFLWYFVFCFKSANPSGRIKRGRERMRVGSHVTLVSRFPNPIMYCI
jgi:hypothetical protein